MSAECYYHDDMRFYIINNQYFPSVTTILGTIPKTKAALGKWRKRVGKEEAERIRNYTAKRGELVHYNCLVNYRDPRNHNLWLDPPEFLVDKPEFLQLPDIQQELILAKAMFNSWQREHDVLPIMIEQKAVSYEHKYAGRFDFYGKIDGKYVLMDIKTSNRMRDSVAYQLGGYYHVLANEKNYPIDIGACLRIHPDLEKPALEFKYMRPKVEEFLQLREDFDKRNPLPERSY